MKEWIKKIVSKKRLLILLLVVFVLVIIVFFAKYIYFQKKLFVPVSDQKIIKQETIEQVLQRLTPAQNKPLTEEEKKQQTKLLEQLTPKKSKPMTQQEQEDLEKLLKKLTP